MSATGILDTQIESVQSWFTDNFLDGETQLFGGPNNVLESLPSRFQVCDGLPSLMTRSVTVKPNGVCPEILAAVNGSCTCLSGYNNNDSVWKFRVKTKDSNISAKIYPEALKATDILEIDAIQTLYVPETLQKLSIIGIGNAPLSLTFVPEYRNQASLKLPIARTIDSTPNLATIELENIDMFSIVTSVSAFMPSSATSVTLRNCNISSFGFEFTLGLNNLTHLDLSSNNLVSAYAGTGNQVLANQCSLTFCGLEEYNLSYNQLTVFPTTPLNLKPLQKFYIQGNSISNFTVDSTTFERIKNLTDFKADSANSSSMCDTGTWEIAHNAKFCVTGNNSTSDTASGNMNQLILVLFAGVVVVILFMCVLTWEWYSYRKNRSSEMLSHISGDDDVYSVFNPDSEYYETMRVRLASDPIMVTNRLEYGEVKIGRCISRGGFGLVFAGTYRSRPVAIKKIRVNKDVEADQIAQFMREITLMAMLRHPRIVKFIGVAWDAVVDLSAVTELMERGDLSTVLHNGGDRMTWSDHKAKIALHIAQALAYLHSLRPKVIHRDLKSKNVLLNEEMAAKLVDFGISRERHDVETHMTAAMGTSFWIAPEVLNGRDYDEKADIFSFGVVLSELDTDDYPYWNALNPPAGKLQEGEILNLVAMGKMRPSFSVNCPDSILKVASRCLLLRPEDRPSAVKLVQIFQDLRATSLSMDSTKSSFLQSS